MNRIVRVCAALLASAAFAGAVSAAPVTENMTFDSTITSKFTGPLELRAELNYDDANAGAPIAVVMAGYSPTNGNLSAIRAHAQRLRDDGFFAVSVAMRGRDGSEGVRDSGGLEIHDIWDAVESVKDGYPALVDPTNVHITGYSGGGGNVMSAVVRFPDYFRVGSSFFGISDYGLDPIEGWYNNGAGSRTTILDQDIGNPNLGDPLVLDRYLARASQLAAANGGGTEVHLFVNDNETIVPLVNHLRFAQIGGAHVTHHVGVSSNPTYEDFNGNGVEDPGELQLWPHGFPSAAQQDAAEQWYRDRLLSGEIPEPQLDPSGQLIVPGFVKTRHFEAFAGDGQDAAGSVTYSLSETGATFELARSSSDPSATFSFVLLSGFLAPPGATAETRINGTPIETFQAGQRRVYFGLDDGDLIDVSILAQPVGPTAGLLPLLLMYAAPLAAIAMRRLA